MTLVRWDPLRDMIHWQNRMNQLLGEGAARAAADDSYGAWIPPVDIFERGDDLVISAELPGVPREEIDVRIEQNTLILTGARKRLADVDQGHFHRAERIFGEFNRRFGLPATVDASRIKARYVDGVLEVVLPKAEGAKPRKVSIEA